jgi:hypothetical protein
MRLILFSILWIVTGSAHAEDMPYNLKTVPWGASAEAVKKSHPRMIAHKSASGTTTLVDENVSWNSRKFRAIFNFDASDALRSILFFPIKLKDRESLKDAVGALEKTFRKEFGDPTETVGSRFFQWRLRGKDIQLLYAPKEMWGKEFLKIEYSEPTKKPKAEQRRG